MRNGSKIIVALIVVVFLIGLVYSAWNSYWQSIPYASFRTGEEIIGFPYGGTSATVDGIMTTPDRTFPQSSTDIFVNITINKLGSPQNQSRFHVVANRFLVLGYQTENGHGESVAWDGFNESMGIFPLGSNSLTTNNSAEAAVLFVLGNGNYSSYQLICKTSAQQKPLFVVDLQGR